MILAALRTYFLANVTVTGLIGQRLFPHLLPQGETTPAADMRIVTADATNYIGGWTKMTQSRVVIDCYSDTSPDDAFAVAKAMRDSGIIGYRGTQSGVFIHGAELDDDITLDTEGVAPGSEVFRYVATFALRVDHSG